MRGARLALNDPRRFWSVDLVTTAVLDEWPTFRALVGPEPLGPYFTADHLKQVLAGRTASIKLLLDQRVVAGLGTIYVCEALYEARISPKRAGGSLTRPRLVRLVEAVHLVLDAAIAAAGSSLRDYARPDGGLGYILEAVQDSRSSSRSMAARASRASVAVWSRVIVVRRSIDFLVSAMPETNVSAPIEVAFNPPTGRGGFMTFWLWPNTAGAG